VETTRSVANDDLGAVTTVADVVARARTQALGCSRRAREHELAYRRWKFWSSLLGVLTAIGATVAASTLLLADTGGARAVVAGLVALAAAAFATVNASFLQGRVEENRVAGAAYTNLRTRYSLLADLPPKEIPAARAQLDDIERAHAQADIEAPPPEGWAGQRRTSEEDRTGDRSETPTIAEPPVPAEPAAERAAPTPAPPRAATAPVPRTVARPSPSSGR
jgi:hypothetical protein